ncbi:MAG TPA: O-antigen ligase family protein [Patescibacteria group bacterium]|nr:O-antigen ligase family protein [Patescibacteria group bacterium]
MAAKGRREQDLRSWVPPGDLRDQLLSAGILGIILFFVTQERYLGFSLSVAILGILAPLFYIASIWKRKIRLSLPITIPFLLFCLVVLFTSSLSKVPEDSVKEVIRYISLFLFFLIGFQMSLRHKDSIPWFANTFFVLGLFLAGSFFIIELLSGNILEGKQFIGPFYWHNQMGAFLLYLLPLALAFFLLQQEFHFIIWVILNVFIATLFVLTYSRASWLSFILSVIPFLVLARRPLFHRWKAFVVLIAGFLLILPFLSQLGTVQPRIESISSEFVEESRTVSGDLRISVYRSAIGMLLDYPFVGVGPGAFGSAFYAYQQDPWLYARYTHNHFLQIASEMGLLGFISFIGLFVCFTFVFLRKGSGIIETAIRGERVSIILMAFGMSLLSSIIHNFLDVDWNWVSLSFLFFFISGLFFGGLYPSKQDTYVFGSPLIRKLVMVTLLLFFFFSSFFFVIQKGILWGKDLFVLEQYDTSHTVFQTIKKVYPLSYTAFLYDARLNHLKGQTEEALSSYRLSYSLNNFSGDALFAQGILLAQQGATTEAGEYVMEAIEKNPYFQPDYYEAVAQLRLQRGDTKGAQEILAVAVEKAFPINESYTEFSYMYEATGFQKKLADTYLFYARVLSTNQDYEKSLEITNIALSKLDHQNMGLQELQAFLHKKISK